MPSASDTPFGMVVHFDLLWEVYARACDVKSRFPEGHLAYIAAAKLIAAFHDVIEKPL